jgi:hypothetical protein
MRVIGEITGSHGDSMRKTVFWDVALYSLVETECRFRDVYCLHHQDETSVNFTRRNGAVS